MADVIEYEAPRLELVGSLAELTLDTGSETDSGTFD